jgi:hypothetical protein
MLSPELLIVREVFEVRWEGPTVAATAPPPPPNLKGYPEWSWVFL